MPKTIILLFDGTSNTISENRTNILRLYGCLKKSTSQIVYYDPGVGTMGPQGFWSRRFRPIYETLAMMTGYGIDDNVKEAYRFLVDVYESGELTKEKPDRICIFGFSRGAYTARMLAGFLRSFGLMEKRNLNLLDYAWRAYQSIGEAEANETFAEIRLYERILQPYRPTIHLLGLFDTVSSVFEPARYFYFQMRHKAWTSRNDSVRHVRHAVALDEKRRFFRPMLWPLGETFKTHPLAPTGVPQDVKEVWFTGSHADVGGGLSEKESGLAKIPLLWMIEETRKLGLDYETRTVNELVLGKNSDKHVPPDPFARIYNSMNAFWSFLEWFPLPVKGKGYGLKITRAKPRVVPDGALIHASVLARQAQLGALQANVPRQHVVEGTPTFPTLVAGEGAGDADPSKVT